jgi:hypothetical protein
VGFRVKKEKFNSAIVHQNEKYIQALWTEQFLENN